MGTILRVNEMRFVQYKKFKIMLVGRRIFQQTFAIHLIHHQSMKSGAVLAPSLDFNYKSLNLNQFCGGQQMVYS